MVRSIEGRPTATIEDIPNELLDRVCAFSETAALKSLRLTSKTCNASAIKALFSHVEVLPAKESVRKCIAILRTDYLNAMVTHIAINTSLTPENEDESENGGWPSERILPDGFDFVLFMIGKFEKLKQVSLRFSRPCVAEEQEGWGLGDHKAISVRDTVRLRHSVLRHLLEGLRHKHHPAKISSLTIKHLQNILNDEVGLSEDLVSTLSGLTSLSLQIAGEVTDFPESDDQLTEPHQFFGTDLCKKILVPASANLQDLRLYSNEYWGFWPFFNFYGLHFPSLKSLTLGNFIFFTDHQLDWIISHADTLRSLTLDDCAILPDARLYNGDQYFPEALRRFIQFSQEDGEVFLHHPARWHDYFRAFSEKLQLRHFGFGHGSWDKHRQLEDSDLLPVELRDDRYLIFDCGTLPTHYIGPEWGGRYDSCWSEYEGGPRVPQCDDEDLEALTELVESIRSRRGGSDLRIVRRMTYSEMVEETEEEVAKRQEDERQEKATREAEWAAFCNTCPRAEAES
ncbi:hypothetical protein HII31_03612 [Pseudocercospora fuligena]|uniref:F-box domain-containing protein n=1 Tax=Pseudocercospora fuligena TaxID=685502 RepID=A0A8H6RPH8_9PEZI|nr:hypothetical protein HII31_03612 [Pseudocercospora fuligena]